MRKSLKDGFVLAVLGFVIAAFVGWIYEQICVLVMYGSFSHRGMLDIPFLPIYGFGAWGLALLLRKVRSGWAFFFLSVLIASVFEYACSYLLEFLFHESFWTYSDWWFSFQDRISLISSAVFGLLAVIFVKCVLPFLRFLMKKVPQGILLVLSFLFIFIIIGDFFLVICRN